MKVHKLLKSVLGVSLAFLGSVVALGRGGRGMGDAGGKEKPMGKGAEEGVNRLGAAREKTAEKPAAARKSTPAKVVKKAPGAASAKTAKKPVSATQARGAKRVVPAT